MQYVEQLVRVVIDYDACRATKYISPNLTMKVTSKRTKSMRRMSRENADLILTIGKPNYAERLFIKGCVRAGEKFPLRNIQIKYPPKKRAA